MSDPIVPLFSLVNGEGAGALLAAAAGDVAGGASPLGYSALTQQATVVSYHLLVRNGISGPDLANEWAELGADGTNPTVFRTASPEFEEWLAGVNTPTQRRVRRPDCEPAARAFPIGIWFRRDPSNLVTAALEVSRLTHMDATTAVATAALAGAMAASAFGQNGMDFLAAVREIAEVASARVVNETEGFVDAAALPGFVDQLSDLKVEGGVEELGPPGPNWVNAAIRLAADASSDPAGQISRAVQLGGSMLGTMVGGLVGARAGLRAWPWAVPNSTWFAELGVRLVSGKREVLDLPVPYYVEETLTYGIERDLGRPFG
ncbi:MAG: ADP-ribosylglycohydrolase family protein [Actinobacteria bacterium]|nr:ADP-ribosylglycohydrolase family protein [Actinomycetota bacterium]